MGEGIKMITEICDKAWTTKQIPKDWKVGIIVPLLKKMGTYTFATTIEASHY